ncbi:MAG TPA: hypothetical protein VHR72_00585 [Gemmataceae bacterium]|nr:hypothetical protein [Gemmataceae bacterium]
MEVVELRGVKPTHVNKYMKAAGRARCVRLAGAEAQRIAELWRDLPAGHQMRCHIPPFGLRFIAEGQVICEGSICWKCNNIFGDVGGEPFAYEFDAKADVSQALLLQLRRVMNG